MPHHADTPVPYPTLNHGTITDEATARGAAATDFGRTVRRVPRAVAWPGSVEDIVTLVRWAHDHRVSVAARGAGHCMNGQGLVQDGLIIDMSAMTTVQAPDEDRVIVEAGATWSDVHTAALAHGLRPPSLTDYLHTTVGGTLSVGGIGGMTHRHGAQTDNVLELDVVTGTGELVTCSPGDHRDLFDTVRAGLGQNGIIVRATLRLAPAQPMTRYWRLHYRDLSAFVDDQRRLVDDTRCDFVVGGASFDAAGKPEYAIETANFCTRPGDIDDDAVLRGLTPRTIERSDLSYSDLAYRITPGIDGRRTTGDWGGPHPWLNLWVPDSAAEGVLDEILGDLTADDLGRGGLVVAYPVPTGKMTTPLLRVPDAPTAWLVSLLLADVDPETLAPWRDWNERCYRRVRDLGGTVYPVGAPDLSHNDWRQHYGPRWADLATVRARTDPRRILNPGPETSYRSPWTE